MTRPLVYVYEYPVESRDEDQLIYTYRDEIADALLLAVTHAEEVRLLADTTTRSYKIRFEITVGPNGDDPHRVAQGVVWKYLRVLDAEREVEKATRVLKQLREST